MCNTGGIAPLLMTKTQHHLHQWKFPHVDLRNWRSLRKRLCSFNINGISCTEACSCMSDDNKFKNPHKDLLNDADGGDDAMMWKMEIAQKFEKIILYCDNCVYKIIISLFITFWRPF